MTWATTFYPCPLFGLNTKYKKCEIKSGCPEAVHCTISWACEITLGNVVCASDM